jgi:hypothetical protein
MIQPVENISDFRIGLLRSLSEEEVARPITDVVTNGDVFVNRVDQAQLSADLYVQQVNMWNIILSSGVVTVAAMFDLVVHNYRADVDPQDRTVNPSQNIDFLA